MQVRDKLLLLIGEMQTKANNNPDTIKTSTLEMFTDDLEKLAAEMQPERSGWEGAVDCQGGSFRADEMEPIWR